MNVVFYKNLSENNRLNKVLTDEHEINGAFRNEVDELNPTFDLEVSDDFPYNYCYIPKFKRYYFVTGYDRIRTNLIRVSTRVDVLMTYKDEILNLDCIVEASEFSGNKFLNSDNFVTTEVQTNTITEFSGEAFSESGYYILITAGA